MDQYGETAENGEAVEADIVEIDVVEVEVVEVVAEVEDEADAEEEDDEEDILLLEEAQDPLVLQVWEPTGEPRVDAALDRLAELDPDDVHQHAAIFDDIHQQLRATLTDLDATT